MWDGFGDADDTEEDAGSTIFPLEETSTLAGFFWFFLEFKIADPPVGLLDMRLGELLWSLEEDTGFISSVELAEETGDFLGSFGAF